MVKERDAPSKLDGENREMIKENIERSALFQVEYKI